jgi:hypothetical protein
MKRLKTDGLEVMLKTFKEILYKNLVVDLPLEANLLAMKPDVSTETILEA